MLPPGGGEGRIVQLAECLASCCRPRIASQYSRKGCNRPVKSSVRFLSNINISYKGIVHESAGPHYESFSANICANNCQFADIDTLLHS